MDYTKKKEEKSKQGSYLIRIAFVAICLSFFLPMFKVEGVVFGINFPITKISGFKSILGLRGSEFHGNPFALAAFVYPLIMITVSFIDFLYEKFFVTVLVEGIVGLLLSLVYFFSEIMYIYQRSTYSEFKTGISVGSLVITLIYLVIIGVSIICIRQNKSGGE